MTVRRLAFALVAAPLTLGLVACGGSETAGSAPPSGEPIAAIAAPAGQAWLDVAATTPEGGVRVGNPEAPLKLVEYASHTCSHCADFSGESSAAIDKLVESGRVSYEIRNQIHDALDLTIAQLVRCGEPAAFHPLANQVWANLAQVFGAAQANQQAVEAAMQAQGPERFQQIARASGLLDFFAARGISQDQALQCLADPAKAQTLAENSETQSRELNVTGTPTFFLNGALVPGTRWADVEPALQKAGAR